MTINAGRTSEMLVLYSPSEVEVKRLLFRLEHVMALMKFSRNALPDIVPPPPPPPSGRVQTWLMSGTVEKIVIA